MTARHVAHKIATQPAFSVVVGMRHDIAYEDADKGIGTRHDAK